MVQIIRYKCCNKVFAACCEPECYTDKDWLSSLKKYVLRGDKVSLLESGGWKFEKCECQSIPLAPVNQLSIFDAVSV